MKNQPITARTIRRAWWYVRPQLLVSLASLILVAVVVWSIAWETMRPIIRPTETVAAFANPGDLPSLLSRALLAYTNR